VSTTSTRAWADIVIDGDVPLAVRDLGGDGPDVLLVHGAGRTALDWVPLVAALRGFRVVALDLRCHGLSGDGPWTWRALLDDLQRAIDRLGLDRPAVVGHSLGGIVASLWGAEHPECPAAINLDGHWSGTAALYDGIAPEVVRERLAHLKALSDQTASPPVPAAQLESVVAAHRAAAASTGLDPALAEEALRRSLQVADGFVTPRPAPEVVSDLLSAVESTDLLAKWAATQCPLLVVSCSRVEEPPGDAPEWMPEMLSAYRQGLTRAVREIAQRHPLVTHQAFDGDHGLIWNQPDAVAQLLEDFLSAVAAT
jgi:pimeloyl-ACP methyl ester carboxylesterase